MPSHLPADVRNRLAQRLRGSLRTARQGAALTQEQLARRIGMPASTYGRVERGTLAPGPETLLKLCQTLCLTLDALVGARCAADVRRASRPARRRRPPRDVPATPPPASPLPWLTLPSLDTLGATNPWAFLAAPRPPTPTSLPVLLVRRGMPLAFVVDVG